MKSKDKIVDFQTDAMIRLAMFACATQRSVFQKERHTPLVVEL